MVVLLATLPVARREVWRVVMMAALSVVLLVVLTAVKKAD